MCVIVYVCDRRLVINLAEREFCIGKWRMIKGHRKEATLNERLKK